LPSRLNMKLYRTSIVLIAAFIVAALYFILKTYSTDGGIAIRAPAGVHITNMLLVDPSGKSMELTATEFDFTSSGWRTTYFANSSPFDHRGLLYVFSALAETKTPEWRINLKCTIEIKASTCRASILVDPIGEIKCHPCVLLD
jgi:hypothetical protein